MPHMHRFTFIDDDHEDQDRQTTSLAALAFALFLVIVGLYLVNALNRKSAVEDCLLAGRANCDQVVSQLR